MLVFLSFLSLKPVQEMAGKRKKAMAKQMDTPDAKKKKTDGEWALGLGAAGGCEGP